MQQQKRRGFTLMMLLLRGISAFASSLTAASSAAPTITSEIPQSPFTTDSSRFALPAVSSPGTAASPTPTGGGLARSPDSAIGT